MKIDIKGTIIRNDDKWIYDFFEMTSTCPRDVLAALEQAKGEKIDVFINSPGGNVFAGSEIYSALRNANGTVRLHVVGLAASAASVIMCAGHCDISPTAMVMIHNATVTEIKREIFCSVSDGVNRAEYYEAMKAGVKLSATIEVNEGDYEKEQLLEQEGTRYKVERVYPTGYGTLELSCSEVVR